MNLIDYQTILVAPSEMEVISTQPTKSGVVWKIYWKQSFIIRVYVKSISDVTLGSLQKFLLSRNEIRMCNRKGEEENHWMVDGVWG